MGTNVVKAKVQNLQQHQPPLSQYQLIYTKPSEGGYKIWYNRLSSKSYIQYSFEITQSNQQYVEQLMDQYLWRYRHEYLVSTEYITYNSPKTNARACVGLFYERILTNLARVRDMCLQDSLYMFYIAFKAFHILFLKFGYFQVQQYMFHITQHGQLKVWVDANISAIYPAGFRVPGTEQNMISKIISIISHNTQRNPGSPLINMAQQLFNHKCNTFQDAINSLMLVCKKHQLYIYNRLKCINNIYYNKFYCILDEFIPEQHYRNIEQLKSKNELHSRADINNVQHQQNNINKFIPNVNDANKHQTTNMHSNYTFKKAQQQHPQGLIIPPTVGPKNIQQHQNKQNLRKINNIEKSHTINLSRSHSHGKILNNNVQLVPHVPINYSRALPVKQIVRQHGSLPRKNKSVDYKGSESRSPNNRNVISTNINHTKNTYQGTYTHSNPIPNHAYNSQTPYTAITNNINSKVTQAVQSHASKNRVYEQNKITNEEKAGVGNIGAVINLNEKVYRMQHEPMPKVADIVTQKQIIRKSQIHQVTNIPSSPTYSSFPIVQTPKIVSTPTASVNKPKFVFKTSNKEQNMTKIDVNAIRDTIDGSTNVSRSRQKQRYSYNQTTNNAYNMKQVINQSNMTMEKPVNNVVNSTTTDLKVKQQQLQQKIKQLMSKFSIEKEKIALYTPTNVNSIKNPNQPHFSVFEGNTKQNNSNTFINRSIQMNYGKQMGNKQSSASTSNKFQFRVSQTVDKNINKTNSPPISQQLITNKLRDSPNSQFVQYNVKPPKVQNFEQSSVTYKTQKSPIIEPFNLVSYPNIKYGYVNSSELNKQKNTNRINLNYNSPNYDPKKNFNVNRSNDNQKIKQNRSQVYNINIKQLKYSQNWIQKLSNFNNSIKQLNIYKFDNIKYKQPPYQQHNQARREKQADKEKQAINPFENICKQLYETKLSQSEYKPGEKEGDNKGGKTEQGDILNYRYKISINQNNNTKQSYVVESDKNIPGLGSVGVEYNSSKGQQTNKDKKYKPKIDNDIWNDMLSLKMKSSNNTLNKL